jgi:Na+-transporting methylmalonyl-CoA/oxaloacetate decarboxylase gamma subunit
MENPLVISLVVTGIGMLMLFFALAVLYGLMYLMTTLIKDRPEAGEAEQEATGEKQGTRSGEPEAGDGRRRAAVIGVALARAELELSQAVAPEVQAGPSAWQQYHRQRVLDLNLR